MHEIYYLKTIEVIAADLGHNEFQIYDFFDINIWVELGS